MSLLFCSANSIARFSVSCTAPALALAAGACDASCANAGAPAVTSAPTHKTSRQTFILNLLATVVTMRASLHSSGFVYRDPSQDRRFRAANHNYSYRSDSIGCSRAAWFAGKYPKKSPVEHETPNAIITLIPEIGTRRFPGNSG